MYVVVTNALELLECLVTHPRKCVRGSVVMNWSVWGEKQRTMPSAHPMKMKSSPRLMQFAEVVRSSTHLTNTFIYIG